jgi:serine/threonine protein kinase
MIRRVTDANRVELLYSLSRTPEGFVIEEARPSAFRTSDGKSIQDIRAMPYKRNAGGRFSRVQTIEDDNKQKYVIKHLIRSYSPDLALDEITTLSAFIGKDYVAQILGAELYSTQGIIVFEYVPGTTYVNWLSTNPSPEERKQRDAEIKYAIDKMHDTKYAHLDISPANVWIPTSIERRAFLLDLGSATPLGDKRKIITITEGYHDPYSNSSISSKNLNLFSYGKLLELSPKPALGGAGGASGGARGKSSKRRRIKSRRNTRRVY